jgi:hypothetical protein
MLRDVLRSTLKPIITSAKMVYYRHALRNEKRFTLAVTGRNENHPRNQGIKSIYRISDGERSKEHFTFATKEVCLNNFLKVFQPSKDDLVVLADNVKDGTWETIQTLPFNSIRTQLNNAGSWRYAAFEIALKSFTEDQVVYFIEDDYLHLPGSPQALLEGLEIADYVSLYDHKDKYLNVNEGGPNPFVQSGGELTRVVRTKCAHWKVTNSTTMTFAATVKVLRQDRNIWDRHTRGRTPNDFSAFMDLACRSRRLITPIPSYSTHCEPAFAAPGIDWASVAKAAM